MKLAFQLLILLSLSLTAKASPMNEGQETNGGDGFAAEFLIELDSLLEQMPMTLILADGSPLKSSVLINARNAVRVSSAPQLILNGVEVAAINRPYATPPEIVVSRSLWRELSKEQRSHLTLHEILPVAGIFDADYKNSSQIYSQLRSGFAVTFSSMLKVVDNCDTGAIQQLSRTSFKKSLTPPQMTSLLFTALNNKCRALVEKYLLWSIPMDHCMGQRSTLMIYMQSNWIQAAESLHILQLLVDAGVPTVKVCANKAINVCQTELGKLPAELRKPAADILLCPL